MISRKHRFHGHNSLRFVYQNGKTVRGPLCSIKYARNPRRGDYRLAVVVSKKISKSAVVRNRVRRRIYEAFRRYEPKLNQPYDMVCTIFHEQVATMPADKLEAMVRAQLQQAKIISKPAPSAKDPQARQA